MTIDLEPENAVDEVEPAGQVRDESKPVAETEVTVSIDNESSAASGDDAVNEQSANRDDDRAPAGDRPQPTGRGSSAMTTIFAGVVGGILALGGYMALDRTGLTGGEGPTVDQAEIGPRLVELKSQIEAGAEQARRAESKNFRGEIAAARTDLETNISANATDIAGLKEELGRIKTALESGDDAAAVTVLGDRLNALEQKVAATGHGPADGNGQARRLNELASRVDGIGQSLTAVRDGSEASKSSIERLGGQIAALADRVDQQEANPEVARAIAAAALKSAIDRGLPFITELETYASVDPGNPDVDALRDLAASGVPSRSAIAAETGSAVDAMIAAMSLMDEDAGILERLLASAQSLIRVRPIGMVEGGAPAAILARMEVAINNDDYAAALEEYRSLPDLAKPAGKAFADKVEARARADELVDKALAAALRRAEQG